MRKLDTYSFDIMFLLLNFCVMKKITNVQKLFQESIALRRYELNSANLIYAADFYASMKRRKIRAENAPNTILTQLLRKDGMKKKVVIDLQVVSKILAEMRRDEKLMKKFNDEKKIEEVYNRDSHQPITSVEDGIDTDKDPNYFDYIGHYDQPDANTWEGLGTKLE
jgi:hypothetical protein